MVSENKCMVLKLLKGTVPQTLGGIPPSIPHPLHWEDAFALGLLAAREVWIRAPVFNLKPKLQMRKKSTHSPRLTVSCGWGVGVSRDRSATSPGHLLKLPKI